MRVEQFLLFRVAVAAAIDDCFQFLHSCSGANIAAEYSLESRSNHYTLNYGRLPLMTGRTPVV
jgi:hypothetical protein